MKRMRCIIGALLFTLMSQAEAIDSYSNVSISTSLSHTVTGLYLQALYAGSSCTGTPVFSNPTNNTYGAMWSGPIAMNNKTLQIGANYLYEMVNIALYEGYHDTDGSINTPTTPGDNSYASVGNTDKWCIKLGIAAETPVTPVSAVTKALLAFASSNSISITCIDSTTTCLASAETVQMF